MTKEIDPQEIPRMLKWQLAKEEHVFGFDIAPTIKGETSCEPRVYGDHFNNAAKQLSEDDDRRHLLNMLSEIMWMRASTDNPEQPFYPMFKSPEGRSAAPEDFVGPHVETIKKCFEICDSPVVKARLAHLAWYLERKRHPLGRAALEEYIKVIHLLDEGVLTCINDKTAFSITGHDILSQALQVSRGLGYPTDLHEKLKIIVADLRQKTVKDSHKVLLLNFAKTDLGSVDIWGSQFV